MIAAIPALLAALLAQAAPSSAAPSSPAPTAATTAATKPLQALVISVEGRAEWRAAGATEFKSAAVNDLLDAGCEIRTGLRSTLALRVGKNATLVVDRASRIELPLIVQDGDVLRTRAAVFRGKCDFKVEAIGVTADFQVLTPSATLAVRGTGFSVQWGALAGLEVKGVDANRMRAIEATYLARLDAYFLSRAAGSSSVHPDPVEYALFDTVDPPPWPDRAPGDLDDDPTRYPTHVQRDLRAMQRILHGGSDFGQDTRSGQGKPGQPPSHG